MADAAQPSDAELVGLRNRIDAVDRELLDLLNRRAELAQQVGEVKRKEGSVAFRPEREAQVIDTLKSLNGGPLKTDSVAPDLARNHVGLPRARDADAGRLPRAVRHVQRTGRARLLRLVDRSGALPEHRRGVSSDDRGRGRFRRRADRELDRRRHRAFARPVPHRSADDPGRNEPGRSSQSAAPREPTSTAWRRSAPTRRPWPSATAG